MAKLCSRVIPERARAEPRLLQRLFIKMLWLGGVLSIIHAVNFVDTRFLAQSYHDLSACHGGLFAYAL